MLKEWTLASALVWIVRRSFKEVDRLAPDGRLYIGRLGDLIADCEEAWIEELRPSLFAGTLQVVAAVHRQRRALGHWPASPCSDPPHLYRRHRFKRRANKGVVKPEEEIISVPVPPPIDLEIFKAVQNRLKVNNPKVTPPRVVSGPNLLTAAFAIAAIAEAP